MKDYITITIITLVLERNIKYVKKCRVRCIKVDSTKNALGINSKEAVNQCHKAIKKKRNDSICSALQNFASQYYQGFGVTALGSLI